MNYTLKFVRETEISIAFLEIMTFGNIGNDRYHINKLCIVRTFLGEINSIQT